MYNQHQLFCNASVKDVKLKLGDRANPDRGVFVFECQAKSKGCWLVIWRTEDVLSVVSILGRTAALLPDSQLSDPFGIVSPYLRPVPKQALEYGEQSGRASTNAGKLVIFGLQFRNLLEYQIQVATLISKRTEYKDHAQLMSRMTALPTVKGARRIQGLLMTTSDAHMTSAIWSALEHHHMLGSIKIGSLRCFMRHCNCSRCADVCFRCGETGHRAQGCQISKQLVCLECFSTHLEGDTAYSMIDCAKRNRLTPAAIRKAHEEYRCHMLSASCSRLWCVKLQP